MKKGNLKVANQLSMMIVITIVIQIFLLVKNSILAANFGVGVEIDSFNFTTNLSNFVFSFIGAGISTVVIPYLKDSKDRKSINIFITIVFLIAIILATIIIMFRREVVLLLGGDSSVKFIEISSNLLFITIGIGLLSSFNTLSTSLLEFNEFFVRQKIVNLIATVISVTVLLLLTDFTIYVYAILIALIATINLVFNLIYLKNTDFKYKISFNINDETFKNMIFLMGPVLFSTGLYQFTVLIDTLIAARLDTGSISILNYSNTIVAMFNMLILTNLTTYFYPKLVKADSKLESQNKLSDYLIIINTLLFFFVTVFFLLGREGIELLYQRGNFTDKDTQIVFIGALIYMLQLPVNGTRDLLYKYFYIEKNTKAPFVNSIIVSILNLVISLVLVSVLGLYGVILGTVLAGYISLFTITNKFNKLFGILFSLKIFSREIFKIIISSLVSFIIVYIMKVNIVLTSPVISIIVYGTFTLVTYAILLKILKSKIFSIKI
ncbi:lipid II flippase MurJ [Marinilactibacillus sp. XAAS-LB27]|uniref:murein biosynthesis integral membrane protein MurJ n=1 Tax=Marinilactibacillus sp. XAAS-LB27 TaxID=3114538 RepID=UPI002E19B05C|nr:lipid II flippase MurJ [Marinilactibacillus sp. XAAS-LB27]